jgi:hypothetical protein
MTLYYAKLGVPQITEQLAEAQKDDSRRGVAQLPPVSAGSPAQEAGVIAGKQRRLRCDGVAGKRPRILGRE